MNKPHDTSAGPKASAAAASSSSSHGKRPANDDPASTKKAERAKRIRVSRACDQCRAGREKCDGIQPECSTCESQRRPCTYHEQPKKRGIQPNYIRTLELTLAWLFMNYPECENRLSQLLPLPTEEVHRLLSHKDAVASDKLHTMWRRSGVSRQIEQLLSGTEIERPGEDSRVDDMLVAEQATDRRSPYQSPPLSARGDTTTVQVHTEHPSNLQGIAGTSTTQQAPPPLLLDHDLLTLPADSWVLLDHYFAFTHTWLPICEKSDILRTMYMYPASGLPRAQATSPEHVELWSIMAWSATRVTSGDTRRTSNYSRAVAQSLIPIAHGFQLGHVKAQLILALIELSKQSWVSAWLVIGSAVRVLTLLTSQSSDRVLFASDRLQHTHMAAFLLEAAISSRIRATTHLRSTDMIARGLLMEDGLEEWSPWQDPASSSDLNIAKSPARSISTFNALVRIAMRYLEGCQTDQISSTNDEQLNVVFELVENASTAELRKQPSELLAQHLSRLKSTPHKAAHHLSAVEPRPHTAPSLQPNYLDMRELARTNFVPEYGYGFLEGAVGNLPSLQGVQGQNNDTSIGTGPSLQQSAGPPANNDLFEQVAMLDPADSSSSLDFMQNLGFGPDLDLAEFFGEDYQPSDPLLAFMQPSTFGNVAPGGRSSDADGAA